MYNRDRFKKAKRQPDQPIECDRERSSANPEGQLDVEANDVEVSKPRFGTVRECRTKTERFGMTKNQEPFTGPVLADARTMDRTKENRTKSPVRTVVLDRTAAALFGEAEIDARCRRLPPNHNIRIFNKGISSLSRVSGAEHNQICRFLLGVIIDIPLPNNISSAKLVRALRGLLDFLYLAQYPCHSAETLQLLDEALTHFHDNKDIFVTLGIRTQFNLPKLHSYRHYLHMIQEYGTTDNYNTEYTERLHIDLAKDAYRATNHKDEYSQMTLWLERREKILRHTNYVHWRLAGDPLPQSCLPPDMQYAREYKMTKHPSVKAATIDSLRDNYGASFFRAALARYIVLHTRPDTTTRAQVEHAAAHVYIPFASLPIFHKVRYNAVDSTGHKDESVTIDSVHCQPARRDKQGNTVPGRFDTVLVNCGNGGEKSVEGYRVAQVRVIFTIPEKHHASLFPSHISIPKHLAYVEWFSPFTGTSERNHGMRKVSRSYENGEQLVSIIPVKDIRRSVHLIPKFGRIAPRDWTSSNVLELCRDFFVNPFTDRHAYATIY